MKDLLETLRRCSDSELRSVERAVWVAREADRVPRGVFAVLIGLLQALKAEEARRAAGAALLDATPEALGWVAGRMAMERSFYDPAEPIFAAFHHLAVVCHETIDLLAEVDQGGSAN